MQPLTEALKEVSRLIVLGALSTAITYFSGLDASWAYWFTVALRALDKYIHEHQGIPLKGLLIW